MPIRIQRDLSPRNVLRTALEWLRDPEHFARGRLFDHDNVQSAGRTCALGAIRKGYYDLDPEHDPTKIGDGGGGDSYLEVPDEVLAADRLLAACLGHNVTGDDDEDSRTAQSTVIMANDGADGYEKIIQGFECAVQKAGQNG